MTVILTGFIAAIILAIIVVVWITYCMFCRERHKSESHQYNIYDLQCKANVHEEPSEEKKEKKGLSAGIIILPSRRKQKDDDGYNKRPDYPESPVHGVHSANEDLLKILNESVSPDTGDRVINLEIDSHSQYHSEV